MLRIISVILESIIILLLVICWRIENRTTTEVLEILKKQYIMIPTETTETVKIEKNSSEKK